MAGRGMLLRSCRLCVARVLGILPRSQTPVVGSRLAAWSLVQARPLVRVPQLVPGPCSLRSVTQRAVHEAASAPSEARPGNPTPPASSHCILNFYHLVDIPRPHEVLEQHRAFLEGREVRGRIYISHQGINAQCGGVTADAVAYVQWLAQEQSLFEGLRYKLYPADDHAFPRLRLKFRPNLISLAGGMAAAPVTDAQARATPLDPLAWKEMLAQAQSQSSGTKPVVLDVRNSYEWDAGHFEGAQRPLEDEFRETPTASSRTPLPHHLEGVDPATPIMMYCTGGIRCDVYSTHLRAQGYSNLYSLDGGIQSYLDAGVGEHWKGSLYVFDSRMAVPAPSPAATGEEGEAGLTAAAPCQVCGGAAVLPHMNCANIDCNKLFIACPACKTHLKGCCSEPCMTAPRLLRPIKDAGVYGSWTAYAGEDGVAAAAIRSGRGSRRAQRRAVRLAEERSRQRAKREEKMERRRLVEQVMAACAAKAPAEAEDPAWRRLREARLKLMAQRQDKLRGPAHAAAEEARGS
ncbi:hypothetical protein ACKKBG_A29660 [Auxenochlorella protothecoides x Auxenochlorella symbiontica]